MHHSIPAHASGPRVGHLRYANSSSDTLKTRSAIHHPQNHRRLLHPSRFGCHEINFSFFLSSLAIPPLHHGFRLGLSAAAVVIRPVSQCNHTQKNPFQNCNALRRRAEGLGHSLLIQFFVVARPLHFKQDVVCVFIIHKRKCNQAIVFQAALCRCIDVPLTGVDLLPAS